MFEIYDGRNTFYQWDLNQKIIINDNRCSEVHFCNGTNECSLIVNTYELNGSLVANVPNILLQSTNNIKAFAYDGEKTIGSVVFSVIAKTKPDNYAYTETEVINWSNLNDKIKEVEKKTGYQDWKLLRVVTIPNPEEVANDESGISWFLNNDGYVRCFQFDTDEEGNPYEANEVLFEYIMSNTVASGSLIVQDGDTLLVGLAATTGTSERVGRFELTKKGRAWTAEGVHSTSFGNNARTSLQQTGFVGGTSIPSKITNIKMGYATTGWIGGSKYFFYVR